jgi:hypothetical protein
MVFKKLFRFIHRALGLKKRRPRKKKRQPRRHVKRRVVRRVKSVRRRVRKAKPRVRKKLRSAPRRKKKSLVKKTRAAVRPKPAPTAKLKAQPAGVITHYFPKVRAAVVKCSKTLVLGDPIWIKGATTDFRQTIGSIQIDRKPIEKARPGQEIGLEVLRDVRPGDKIYAVKTP